MLVSLIMTLSPLTVTHHCHYYGRVVEQGKREETKIFSDKAISPASSPHLVIFYFLTHFNVPAGSNNPAASQTPAVHENHIWTRETASRTQEARKEMTEKYGHTTSGSEVVSADCLVRCIR